MTIKICFLCLKKPSLFSHKFVINSIFFKKREVFVYFKLFVHNPAHVFGFVHLQAAYSTGDRVWRMPLFELYQKHVTDCHLADVNNIGKYSRAAGSCTAAAFLKVRGVRA